MSLVTEDGTGKSDAESYCSVAAADSYHSNHANAAWAALTTGNKEASLRKATEYMMGQYRLRWLGRRVLITQSLDWPRVGVVLEDFGNTQGGRGIGSYGLFQLSFTIVPPEVITCCAELALRASASDLNADLTQKVRKETVGPITVEYANDAPQWITYRQVDSLLRVYLIAGGNSNMAKLGRC